ncbi:uncharacterized protein [Dermacentor albipictus]|uniref:uncharacterized protein isoform X2 n=1 Tax=Dermacentor albipictus TaxID=60249 RepID=UPI0031FC7492
MMDMKETTLFDEDPGLSGGGGGHEGHGTDINVENPEERVTGTGLPRKETAATRNTRFTPAVENIRPSFSTAPTPSPTTPSSRTPRPATLSPTAPRPATPRPTKPRSTTPRPAKPGSTTPRPTTTRPTTARTSKPRPTKPGPTTQRPTTQRPTTLSPTTVSPTTPSPTTPSPTTVTPTTPSSKTPNPTTPSKMPITRSTRVPVAPAAPTGTVVCTVSNLMPPETSALPPDGACDLLFFESFYKDNKNNLSGGYNAIEPNARVFLEQARNSKMTQYGASFAPTKTFSSAEFTTSNFYKAVDVIWNRKIHHFGFLNLYLEFSAPEVVREALLALKELYLYVKRINQQRQPSYQILGLSVDDAQNYPTQSLMRSVFVPSMFISIGHVSYSDASFKYCHILPPIIRYSPPRYHRHDKKDYGHSIGTSVNLLERVSHLRLNVTLAISVGLSGRHYRPYLPAKKGVTVEHYTAFKRCRDFNGSRYDDPVKLCPGVVGGDWKVYKSREIELYLMVYSLHLERTFLFENVQSIKKKLCLSREYTDGFTYGVAAYDVDFDSSPEGCPEMDIESGAFGRLSTIRSLSNYIINYRHGDPCSIVKLNVSWSLLVAPTSL